MPTALTPSSIVTLRPATPDDDLSVRRLAQLDSSDVPAGALLLALVDGTPLAALSLDTGAVIADPFSRTLDLVAVLHERAARIKAAEQTCGAGRRERLPVGSARWLAMLFR